MKTILVILISIICVLVVLVVRKPTPEPPDEHLEVINRLRAKSDSLQNQLDILIIHYRNVSAAYREASTKVLKIQRKYELEKKRKVAVLSDAAYDSVLNRLYPR